MTSKLLAAAIFLLGACSTATSTGDSLSNGLVLTVDVQEREAGRLSALALITLRNVGKRGVSITKTFGYAGAYFELEIRDSNGETLEYPISYELFSDPPYVCLRPGDSYSFTVDLNNWQPSYGGGPPEGPFLSFGLIGGDYTLKAIYREPGPRREKKRCPSARGSTIESEWVQFTLGGPRSANSIRQPVARQIPLVGLRRRPVWAKLTQDGALTYDCDETDNQTEPGGAFARRGNATGLVSPQGEDRQPWRVTGHRRPDCGDG